MSRFAVIGAVLAGLAVAFGAFGAHALANRVSEARLDTFETGVRYQLWHGLALFALGLARYEAGPWLRRGAWLLLAGSALFAGSLYLLVLTDNGAFAMVAPLGGAAMIAGWGALTWGLAREHRPSASPAVAEATDTGSEEHRRQRG